MCVFLLSKERKKEWMGKRDRVEGRKREKCVHSSDEKGKIRQRLRMRKSEREYIVDRGSNNSKTILNSYRLYPYSRQ